MSDGHIYKKIITTGADKDATHIAFYAKATGLFMKLFGIAESKIMDASSNLSDLGSASTARTNLGAPFAITLISGVLSPADATTYYFSHGFIVPTITATDHDFNFGYAFTIIGADVIVSSNTTAGTGEASTIQLRNTTQATSTSIGSITTSGGSATVIASFSFTGLSIAVAAGDSVAIQFDAATFATNPAGMRLTVTLIIIRN